MRIAIIGGSGYLGKVLYRRLTSDGRCSSLLSIDRRYDATIRNCDFISADIMDEKAICRALRGVEVVVHLAAVPYVAQVREAAVHASRINVDGTRNVLAASVDAERFIFLSTSGVYGAQEGRVDERSPLNPLSAYAEQKVKGEGLVRSSGIPSIILRVSNLYGVGVDLPPQPLVHRMIESALSDGTLRVYSGSMVRNFIHVNDCAAAIVSSCFHGGTLGPFNVGNEDVPLVNVAEMIKAELGLSGLDVNIEIERPGPVVPFTYVHDRIRTDMGFGPGISLAPGIRNILDHISDPS